MIVDILKPKDYVNIINLINRKDLNNLQGTLISWNHDNERWIVKLDSSDNINVKPINLELYKFNTPFFIVDNLDDNGIIDFDVNLSYNGYKDKVLEKLVNHLFLKMGFYNNEMKLLSSVRTTNHKSLDSETYLGTHLNYINTNIGLQTGNVIVILHFNDVKLLCVVMKSLFFDPTFHFHIDKKLKNFEFKDIEKFQFSGIYKK